MASPTVRLEAHDSRVDEFNDDSGETTNASEEMNWSYDGDGRTKGNGWYETMDCDDGKKKRKQRGQTESS